MEVLPNATRRFALLDKRTNKYFGGGRVDKLFSLWIEDIQKAKFFEQPEEIKQLLLELVRRNEEIGVEVINENPVIGPNIPPYADDAYIMQEVLVTPPTQK